LDWLLSDPNSTGERVEENTGILVKDKFVDPDLEPKNISRDIKEESRDVSSRISSFELRLGGTIVRN